MNKQQPYFYVFVRRDIPLADQACQVAHVAADAGKRFQYPDGIYLVLLGVDNQHQLLELRDKLVGHQIEFCLALEPDDNMGYTALATRTMIGEERRLFSDYKTWRA